MPDSLLNRETRQVQLLDDRWPRIGEGRSGSTPGLVEFYSPFFAGTEMIGKSASDDQARFVDADRAGVTARNEPLTVLGDGNASPQRVRSP